MTVRWGGFANTRDLGGLPLRDGGTTASGRVFRSATLRFVTAEGWAQAWDAGLRTIVDLRNDDEVHPPDTDRLPGSALFADLGDAVAPPARMERVRVPLDDVDDVDLWRTIRSEGLDGTPLYYPLFVERKANRCADAVRAVARAGPGGVLFHCGAGRDRTGLLSLLLLALAGVTGDAIATDYDESARAVPDLLAAMGAPDQEAMLRKALHARRTTTRDAVLDVLTRVDVHAALRDGGLSDRDVTAARSRLRER